MVKLSIITCTTSIKSNIFTVSSFYVAGNFVTAREVFDQVHSGSGWSSSSSMQYRLVQNRL